MENYLAERDFKKIGFSGLRVSLSFGLLLLLLRQADLTQMVDLMSDAKLSLFVLIILWLLLDRVVHGIRWVLLLRVKLPDVPVGFLMRVHFISNFLSHFIPFNLGNDGTRVASVANYSSEVVHSASSVIVDRIMGLLSLLLPTAIIIGATILRRRHIISPETDPAILVLVVLALGLLMFLWLKGVASAGARRIAASDRAPRWSSQLASLAESIEDYRSHPKTLLVVFLILELALASGILVTFFVSQILGIDVSLGHLIAVVPIISLLSLMPISLNGIGIAEAAFVFFLAKVGISASEALLLALTIRSLMIIATLPGAVFLATGGLTTSRLPLGKSAKA